MDVTRQKGQKIYIPLRLSQYKMIKMPLIFVLIVVIAIYARTYIYLRKYNYRMQRPVPFVPSSSIKASLSLSLSLPCMVKNKYCSAIPLTRRHTNRKTTRSERDRKRVTFAGRETRSTKLIFMVVRADAVRREAEDREEAETGRISAHACD